MKTKRIIMYIELFLFIIGIFLASYFGIINNYDLKISSLISNVCIGISTGGLVSFLVAIPTYITESKYMKGYIYENARLLYVYTYQLSYLIDDAMNHPNIQINDKMCNHNLDLIISQATKLYIIDIYLFSCKCKVKQLSLFKEKMCDIFLNKLPTINQLQLSVNKMYLGNVNGELTKQEFPHILFSKELMNIKTEAQKVLDLLDNTIRVIYNKKVVNNWDDNIRNINICLQGTS